MYSSSSSSRRKLLVSILFSAVRSFVSPHQYLYTYVCTYVDIRIPIAKQIINNSKKELQDRGEHETKYRWRKIPPLSASYSYTSQLTAELVSSANSIYFCPGKNSASQRRRGRRVSAQCLVQQQQQQQQQQVGLLLHKKMLLGARAIKGVNFSFFFFCSFFDKAIRRLAAVHSLVRMYVRRFDCCLPAKNAARLAGCIFTLKFRLIFIPKSDLQCVQADYI